MAMPDSTFKAFGAGVVGVVVGLSFLGKGVLVMGIPSVLLGGACLWLAFAAEAKRRPAGRAHKQAHAQPFNAPAGKVGDLVIIEAWNGGGSPFWLAQVGAVDGRGRVTAVTTCRGLTFQLTMIRPYPKTMQVCSATHFDVPDAMRRELARSDAEQRWTSREEVIAQLRPASTAH